MAASVWRMNGLCVAGVLVLCALLLTNEVKCQEDTPAATTPAPGAADAVPGSTAAPAAPATPAASGSPAADSASSAAPGDLSLSVTLKHEIIHPVVGAAAPEGTPVVIKPDVKCVGKEDITESNAVNANVNTKECEATKNVIEEVPARWCSKLPCTINIHQDGNTVLLDSKDVKPATLAEALQSKALKDKLDVSHVSYTRDPSVFVGILVTGLLLALGLTVGYFKCQRRPCPKGERLAEEGTPVDQQNQANTLASDAPLNPPPETPEKPSVNGESPEADKTEPPPTNGHSTANTADTEL